MFLSELGSAAQHGWIKSSISTNGNCCLLAATLEIGSPPRKIVALRDSKLERLSNYDPRYEPVIVLSIDQWELFLQQVRIAGLKTAGIETDDLLLTHAPGGGVEIRSGAHATCLSLTEGEWAAFVAGAQQGEMTIAELAGAR